MTAAGIFLAAGLAPRCLAQDQANAACASCHAQIAGEHARGVHSQIADCTVCHADAHQGVPAGSVAFRKRVPDTCGMCHQEVAEQYKASVHGQALDHGVKQAPLCTDCHGEHSIEKHTAETSPVHVRHIRETCARCHGDIRLTSRFGIPPDRVASFDATFHGLAARAGSETVANCASCHGVHNILASSDPKSTVHPKNLANTCGKCHTNAGKRFALGPIHQTEGRVEPPATRFARQVYLVLIPLVLVPMFLHNAGDWIRKLARRSHGARPIRTAQPELRMFPLERVQHALLAVSFFVLVWTGFALKYPDPWWARPLTWWGAHWDWRGIIHRIAAILFLVVALLHVVALVSSSRLRGHWRSLWPRRTDLREAWENFSYNLGWRREQPRLSSHSYVEKAEYWAVVWGAVIMTLTGLVLWAHDLALAWLPKSVSDFATAVHFYEAILAALSIVLWHFYFVIFDPDVYPMDTAWLTGLGVKPRENPREPEPLTLTNRSDEQPNPPLE
jgi:cytochrome b subunit of formate dehydrogenase